MMRGQAVEARVRRALILVSALLAATPAPGQTGDIGAPPGKLVEAGSRKLHIYCTGSGSPAVIFEAGASAFAIDWALVQPQIARTNRVCSYDRAGSGWSDPAGAVETPARVVHDLHVLMQTAGEPPPYVLVGASRGGLYVRLYQLRYPEEVAGMVLVDPADENRLFTMFEGKPVLIASLTADQRRSSIPPGPISVPRRQPQTGAPFDRLPKDLYALRVKLDARLIASIPESVPNEVVVESAEGERTVLAELRQHDRPLGGRPVVVLTRGVDAPQDLKDVHASLRRLSTNFRHTVVAGSGHEIHLFEPGAVVQAIRDVLESVRTGSQLSAR